MTPQTTSLHIARRKNGIVHRSNESNVKVRDKDGKYDRESLRADESSQYNLL